MGMPNGSINAWKCSTCGKLIVAIHRSAGTTPMFLACKDKNCKGRAASFGYPDQREIPDYIMEELEWEWYKPQKREYKRLDNLMKSHVDQGGLLLRPIRKHNGDTVKATVQDRA